MKIAKLFLVLSLILSSDVLAQPRIQLIDSAKKAWMPDAKGTIGLRFRNAGNQTLIVSNGSIRSANNVFNLLTSFAWPKIVAPGDSSYVTVEFDAQIAYEYFAFIDLVSNDPQRPITSFALRVNDSIPPNPVSSLATIPQKAGLLALSWEAPLQARDFDSTAFYRAFIITRTGESEEIYTGKGRSVTTTSKFEGEVFVSVLAYDDMGNRSVMLDTTFIDRTRPRANIQSVDIKFHGVPEHIERGNPRFSLEVKDWRPLRVDAFWREVGSTQLQLIAQHSTFAKLREDHEFGFNWNTSQLRGMKELVLISRDQVENIDTTVYTFTISQIKGWPKRMFNHQLASSVTIGHDDGGRFIMAGSDIANGIFRPSGHHYYYNWPLDITRPLQSHVITAAADFDGDNRSEIVTLSPSDEVLILDHRGMTEKQFGEVTFSERYASVIDKGDSAFILAGHAPIAVRSPEGSYRVFGASQSWRPDGTNAELERVFSTDGLREKDRYVVANLLDPGSENIVHVRDNGEWEEFSIRNESGKLESGPFNVWKPNASYTGFFPSIGDIDGDDDLEIILPAANDSLYAYHHTGVAVNGYPVHLMSSSSGRNQAMIVDINGDGASDIILPVNDSIVAIDGKRATMISNDVWPIRRKAPGTSLITIADANSDGYLELIEPPSPGDTSWVYVYDLNARNEQGSLEWGTFQHDMQRSGNYNTPSRSLQSKVEDRKSYAGLAVTDKVLTLKEGGSIRVLDLLGRHALSASLRPFESLDLSQLEAGVYFVRIDELITVKIVL